MNHTSLVVVACLVAGCKPQKLDDGAVFGPFTQVKTFFTSAFVASSVDGPVVVDSGYSKTAAPVANLLAATDHDLGDVAHVFVTHGHSDHVRGLGAFANARIWAHEDEVELIAEESGGVEVTDTLIDGQLVEIGDLAFETLHVPGHSDGNVAFLAGGVLLMGDTAMAYKDGTVGPPPERYVDDPEAAADALLGLRDRLEPRRDEIIAVAFAHSGGLTDSSPFWEMSAGD